MHGDHARAAPTAATQTLCGVSAATFEIDDSEIVLGDDTMIMSSTVASGNSIDPYSPADVAAVDWVAVNLTVSSSSGSVCAAMHVVSSDPQFPNVAHSQVATPSVHAAAQHVSLSLTPVSEPEAEGQLIRVVLEVQPTLQDPQQQQAHSHHCTTKDIADVSKAAHAAMLPQQQSAYEWIEVHLCVNTDADVSVQELDEPSENVISSLQSTAVCLVTFEVVEEVMLVLQHVPVADAETSRRSAEAGPEEPSAHVSAEASRSSMCTPPCHEAKDAADVSGALQLVLVPGWH